MSHEKHAHLYEEITVSKLESSEVEITGSIPESEYLPLRKQALHNLTEHLELPGFRKGRVPESVFIERFGENTVLEEIADIALRESYPHIVIDEKLDILGTPQISITKLAKGNPIEFRIRTAIYPTVTLPDYKALAKNELSKTEDIIVTEEEMKNTIRHLRKSRIPHDKVLTKDDAEKEENWPAYTDAFVQSLGAFSTVADFEIKLKENIAAEKTRVAKEKTRAAILNALAENTAMTVPKILVESELNKMLTQFEEDVMRMGATLEKYLEHIKKTKEDMLKDWQGDALKRAKLDVILREIAETEKLKPIEEDILHEVDHLKGHHPQVDPERIRIYVESMLEKEKVMKFLEEQK